jgi:hypothetical protein
MLGATSATSTATMTNGRPVLHISGLTKHDGGVKASTGAIDHAKLQSEEAVVC